jgi:hypothetical protein
VRQGASDIAYRLQLGRSKDGKRRRHKKRATAQAVCSRDKVYSLYFAYAKKLGRCAATAINSPPEGDEMDPLQAALRVRLGVPPAA